MARIYNHPDGTFAVEFGVLINGQDDELTGATEQYSSGYWVAITNNVVTDKLQFDQAVEDLIEDGHKLIGIWYDKDKDVTYVDGVEHVVGLISAIRQGQALGQTAIYDIKHRQTIYLT